jgi:hypothetical protein
MCSGGSAAKRKGRALAPYAKRPGYMVMYSQPLVHEVIFELSRNDLVKLSTCSQSIQHRVEVRIYEAVLFEILNSYIDVLLSCVGGMRA